MIKTEFIHRAGKFKWTCREWKCCGKLWQLLLSRSFPDRYDWSPTCTICGEK